MRRPANLPDTPNVAYVMPLRVGDRDEALGLDVTQHGEQAYMTGEGAILLTMEGAGEVDGESRTGVGVAQP